MKDYTEDRDLAGIKLLAVDMDLTLRGVWRIWSMHQA